MAMQRDGALVPVGDLWLSIAPARFREATQIQQRYHQALSSAALAADSSSGASATGERRGRPAIFAALSACCWCVSRSSSRSRRSPKRLCRTALAAAGKSMKDPEAADSEAEELHQVLADVARWGTRRYLAILCVRANDIFGGWVNRGFLSKYISNAPVMLAVTQVDLLPGWQAKDPEGSLRRVQAVLDQMMKRPKYQKQCIKARAISLTGRRPGLKEFLEDAAFEGGSRDWVVLGAPKTGKTTLVYDILRMRFEQQRAKRDPKIERRMANVLDWTERKMRRERLKGTLEPVKIVAPAGAVQEYPWAIIDTPPLQTPTYLRLQQLSKASIPKLLGVQHVRQNRTFRLQAGQSFVLTLPAILSPTGDALPLVRMDVVGADGDVFMAHFFHWPSIRSRVMSTEEAPEAIAAPPPPVIQEATEGQDNDSKAEAAEEEEEEEDDGDEEDTSEEAEEEDWVLRPPRTFNDPRPLEVGHDVIYRMDISVAGIGTLICRSYTRATIQVYSLPGLYTGAFPMQWTDMKLEAGQTKVLKPFSPALKSGKGGKSKGYKMWPPAFRGIEGDADRPPEYNLEVQRILAQLQLEDLLYDVGDKGDKILKEAEESVENVQKTLRSEIKKRAEEGGDFRKKRVFTIDPATARDLDDAIHVERVEGGKEIKVGVHIADVTHYLMDETTLDEEARSRSTSVYLPDRVLPMLPRILSDDVCSLHPGTPKLCMTVIFHLRVSDGKVLKSPPPKFYRGVIQSCCRLSYEDAQDIVDGNEITPLRVLHGHSWEGLMSDVQLLHDVTMRVRESRFRNGALDLATRELCLSIEEFKVSGYELSEPLSSSHWLIEELMLIANRVVAEKLGRSKYKQQAVVRAHPPPDSEQVQELSGHIDKIGIDVPSKTGTMLANALRRYQDTAEDPDLAQAVAILMCITCLAPARYAPRKELENTSHWALGFPIYTHFTSPIRRYADVMVHRQLKTLMDKKGFTPADLEKTMEQCDRCNERSKYAEIAERITKVAFLALHLVERGEYVRTHACVVNIFRSYMEVVIPELGGLFPINFTIREKAQPHPSSKDEELELPLSWELGRAASKDNAGRKGQRERIEILWTEDEKPQVVLPFSIIDVVVVPLQTVPIELACYAAKPQAGASARSLTDSPQPSSKDAEAEAETAVAAVEEKLEQALEKADAGV